MSISLNFNSRWKRFSFEVSFKKMPEAVKWLLYYTSNFSVRRWRRVCSFLVETQQASELERQHLERLTRRNQQLQRRFREVSAQKAELTSFRVDLNGQGKAWREAMASQSEIYVKNLSALEASRSKAFSERVALMQVGGGRGVQGIRERTARSCRRSLTSTERRNVVPSCRGGTPSCRRRAAALLMRAGACAQRAQSLSRKWRTCV